MSQNDHLPQIRPRQEVEVYRQIDDEISLIDLIKVLIKRKTTLFTVFSLFVLAGILIAFLSHKQYRYSSTIEIGARSTEDETQLIESPDTLLAKIQNTYDLIARTNYHKAHPEDNRIYDIKASIPKNSTVIVLDAKGSLNEEPIYKQIMNDIIRQVVDDHNRLLEVLRKEYQLKIEKKQNSIAGLEGQLKVLQGQGQRLEENKKLVEKQIEQTRKTVNDSLDNRKRAGQHVKDDARAMTLLTIDNEIQQERNRLDDLQEKLTVTLANQKDSIETSIANTQRKISETKLELGKDQLELKNLRATHALVPPIKSIKSIGISKMTKLLVSIVVGLFISLFVAFLHEFIVKARDELRC